MIEEVKTLLKPGHILCHGPVDMVGVGIGVFTKGFSHVVQHIENNICFHFTFPRAHFFTLDDLFVALRIPTHEDLYAYPKIALVEHPKTVNEDDIENLWTACNRFNGMRYDTKELFNNHLKKRFGIDAGVDLSDPERWVCSSGIAHLWKRCLGKPWPGHEDFGYGPEHFLENGRVLWESPEA